MGRVWVWWLVLGVSALSGEASPLAPHLDEAALRKWVVELQGPFRGKDLEQLEMAYQKFVQPQTYRDLMAVYDPKNADKILIAYPSFTPEGDQASPDLGYGFHVVKRLVLDLPDGSQKIIDVNEHWPENRNDHGLFLPDAIRVKTRVLDGDRYVPGSERHFLFDSLRLAWGPANELSLQRQTRYIKRGEQLNQIKKMRVPVSAPVTCLTCHDSGSVLHERFIEEGGLINREAIVQDSFFTKPYSEMFGYEEYVAYLTKRKVAPEFIARVKRDLADPNTAFAVPGIVQALKEGLETFSWLGDDEQIKNDLPKRQGAYKRGAKWYLDSTEEIFEGKYRWWEPATVVPREAGASCSTFIRPRGDRSGKPSRRFR